MIKAGDRGCNPLREMKIWKLGNDRWTEHFPKSEHIDALHEFIQGVFEKYGKDLKGTFKASIKFNGGYGKNHDTGATTMITVTGYLGDIWMPLEHYFEGHRILYFRR